MSRTIAAVVLSAAAFIPSVIADEPRLYSSSLNTCQDNSGFTARLFNFVFTPNNGTVSANIVAVSSITGKVVFDVAISAYGYEFLRRTIDPCDSDSDLAGLCPMRAGNLVLPFNIQVDKSATSQIPGIAYTFPDLDATARVYINMTEGDDAGQSAACVEANISNGKTVNLAGVKWATAAVAILALLSSALVSGLGHTNAASHIAAGAVSLFGYFQAQAMLGLTGIRLPPVARAWTQDFQWSMGIIKLDFMQSIFTWYQRATGGSPSTLFDTLTTTSVQVEKRDLSQVQVVPVAGNLFSRAAAMAPKALTPAGATIAKRGNIQTGSGSYVVYGIQRVAFASGIESTNLFMTGLTFFCVFVIFSALLVLLFRLCCGFMAKRDAFLEFRNGWRTVLKGILYRVCLIGFPIVAILCLWELTQRDSAAEVVLAIFFFFGTLALLGYAAFKIISIARRSISLHRNPAYILFSDPQTLNKWGFLYVPYRASGYYFFAPVLGHVLIKCMFIALAQDKGTLQAIALILIEAAALIAASVLRPWMDKSTNSFNIAIYAINFINAVFLLIFTNVFDQPPLVTGVIGVVLWILNNVFALVLLLMLIITTIIIFFQKNPDNRYQYMLDDRTSFIKSQTNLGTNPELDALAVTARGAKGPMDLLDDEDYDSSDARGRHVYEKPSMSSASASYRDRHSSPAPFGQDPAESEDHRKYQVSPMRDSGSYSDPSLYSANGSRVQPNRTENNTSSPWQRGAGYENGT
ncbi:TRP-domain-containing protein [Coniochaeta ligniaria NRRL 30616]|uniref:TRP-domain-containing protein n=1 Tax=Coniochaeta ligniaria NRRL 30616 TaxID=1408157 RepID=A0A1J7I5L6_9PEZI|nr:TRP-domain-containing protein [Coniochaeta ligniaria NRRL 30616]